MTSNEVMSGLGESTSSGVWNPAPEYTVTGFDRDQLCGVVRPHRELRNCSVRVPRIAHVNFHVLRVGS